MDRQQLQNLGKWTRRFAHALGLLLGVILPLAAFCVELATDMCWEIMSFDPIPNILQGAVVLSVPLINLALWICLRKGVGGGKTCVHLLAGFVTAVSSVYAVIFLPASVLGGLVCVLSFWYFGFGFIGLLPSAPLFAALTAGILHLGLRRQAAAQGVPARGFGWGWLAALVVGLLGLVPTGLGHLGIRQAVSDDPATAARGIHLLRRYTSYTSDRSLLRQLHNTARGSFLNPYCWLTSRDAKPLCTAEDARRIYYRVTGKATCDSELLSGRRRRRLAFWDSQQGGEKIGDVLEGLSLKDSAWETKIDKKTAIGYAEWTLVFGNSYDSDREARLRLDLPKGAVVSRATLWIGGEEREAAFGTKGQVRQAYESVVRRNRDPLLVNVSGPDQIQVQCFPVPRDGGEMKIRLGLTLPLAVAADGKSLQLTPPVISAQNFSLPADLAGLPTAETFALDAPPAAVAVYTDDATDALKGAAVLQRLTRQEATPPRKIAVVVDTSVSMKDVLPRLGPALKQAPADAEIAFWFAADQTRPEPSLVSPAGDKSPCRGFIPDGLLQDQMRCAGGRDNVKPLLAALDWLNRTREQKTPCALFWLCGPQPVDFPGAEAFAAKLAGSTHVQFFLCPFLSGPCVLTVKLRPSPRITVCHELPAAGDPAAALGARFASLSAPVWQAAYEKVAADAVPADAVPADRHLARLWAAQEAVKTYRVGDPKTLEAAQQIALPWQIVTPVTGAVVLETAQQYKDNNLTPANASSVPTTPEPANVLLVALALLVLVVTLLVQTRRRRMEAR